MINRDKRIFEIFHPEDKSPLSITISDSPVHAGFPSPADDHIEQKLDLNKALVKNPSTTFFARVKGESMIGDGVEDGDILVIDKSQDPYENCIAVCFLEGEFTLKRIRIQEDKITLLPANKRYKPIEVNPDDEFTVWGVVRSSINMFR